MRLVLAVISIYDNMERCVAAARLAVHLSHRLPPFWFGAFKSSELRRPARRAVSISKIDSRTERMKAPRADRCRRGGQCAGNARPRA